MNCICCDTPLIVDCFCAKSGFLISVPAPNDGDIYYFIAEYYGAQIRLKSEPTVAGSPIVFLSIPPDSNILNPFYVYQGVLYLNGVIQTLYIGADPYQCIELHPKQYGWQGTTPAVLFTPTP